MKKLMTFLIISAICVLGSNICFGAKEIKKDIILVLDNSGSMKQNDPAQLSKEVVKNFVLSLTADSRAGVVIFDEGATLSAPLTLLSDKAAKDSLLSSLNRLDYSGRLTNSPAGVERAIYELKQNSRKDAQRIIIFMTDGIVDTGNKTQDIEKAKWLQEELSIEAKKARIRIFGIAFTDKADFQLIQVVAQKTGAEYYRALKPDDIQGIFNKLNQAISKPLEELDRPKATEGKERGFIILIIAGLILVAIVAIVSISRRKTVSSPESPIDKPVKIPPAKLIPATPSITPEMEYNISKKIFKIGRSTGNDLVLEYNTVSGFHATIEYRDNSFYLIDQRSSNGSFVNGQRITELRLKSGDKVAFDQYKFTFLVAGEEPGRGTVIRQPGAGGGTVIRGKGTPSADDKPEGKAPESPAIPHPAPKENDGEGTRIKVENCPNHPAVKATELCPECKNGYCPLCMVEVEGRKICKKCTGNR